MVTNAKEQSFLIWPYVLSHDGHTPDQPNGSIARCHN